MYSLRERLSCGQSAIYHWRLVERHIQVRFFNCTGEVTRARAEAVSISLNPKSTLYLLEMILDQFQQVHFW